MEIGGENACTFFNVGREVTTVKSPLAVSCQSYFSRGFSFSHSNFKRALNTGGLTKNSSANAILSVKALWDLVSHKDANTYVKVAYERVNVFLNVTERSC